MYVYFSGTIPLTKRLLPNAVPHIFEWSKVQTTAQIDRAVRKEKRNRISDIDLKDEVGAQYSSEMIDTAMEVEISTHSGTETGKRIIINTLHYFLAREKILLLARKCSRF